MFIQIISSRSQFGGGGKSELLTFTDEIFFRGLSTDIPMKMQNCKWDFFFSLLIWSVGKRGMIIGGMHSPPCSAFWGCNREVIHFIWPDRIWNVIARFPRLNHYLLFDSNVSLFLPLQYCLHFTFVKRALIEPYKVFLSFCKINEDVFTGPQHSVHSTIMDFSLCWLKALFLCYLSILYLLLDCSIKGYLAKHWNNNCISWAEVVTPTKYMQPLVRQVTFNLKTGKTLFPSLFGTILWLQSSKFNFFLLKRF